MMLLNRKVVSVHSCIYYITSNTSEKIWNISKTLNHGDKYFLAISSKVSFADRKRGKAVWKFLFHHWSTENAICIFYKLYLISCIFYREYLTKCKNCKQQCQCSGTFLHVHFQLKVNDGKMFCNLIWIFRESRLFMIIFIEIYPFSPKQ